MINKSLREILLKDLVFVILYSLVLPLLLGVLLGLFDYYLQAYLNFSYSSMLYWLIAIMTGSFVRKQYDQPHILYSVIAGIGMIFAWTVIYTLPSLYAFSVAFGTPEILYDVTYYFQSMILFWNPLNWFSGDVLRQILLLLIVTVGTYLGIKRTL